MKNDKIKIIDPYRDSLRNMRKQMGIRTDILSVMIQKTPSYISQIESGRIKTISESDLELIAHAIGCSVDAILCRNGNTRSGDDVDNCSALVSENIALKKENEYLKKKLEYIMQILKQ